MDYRKTRLTQKTLKSVSLQKNEVGHYTQQKEWSKSKNHVSTYTGECTNSPLKTVSTPVRFTTLSELLSIEVKMIIKELYMKCRVNKQTESIEVGSKYTNGYTDR